VETNDDVSHAITLMSGEPNISSLKGNLATYGWSTSEAEYRSGAMEPNPDEPEGTSTLTSSPRQIADANNKTTIEDPQLRLGPGGIYALDQAGFLGGKLAPGAMTLNTKGDENNLFTSFLDPSKIDATQPPI